MSGHGHVVAQDDAAAGDQPPAAAVHVHTMPNGDKIETQVFSAADPEIPQILHLWTQNMRRRGGLENLIKPAVVGFDVEWSMVQEEAEGEDGNEINPRVTLLKMGSSYGCLLLKLDFKSRSSVHYSLRHFLLTKYVTFVGIHIKEDLIKLSSDHGIVIRNVLDLADAKGDLTRASSGINPLYISTFNVRGLVNGLIKSLMGIETGIFDDRSSLCLWLESWGRDGLTEKQIEVAATEVYLLHRVAADWLLRYC